MEVTLHNQYATATINSLGAELTHFITHATQHNYIWSGDATFWSGRSPVLFPIIGSLNNNQICINGQYYAMGNHGFARRSQFDVIESSMNHAIFRLKESPSTLELYPFSFTLDLIYTLEGTSLSIDYHVTNTDTQPLPFSLGTHPAFVCPMGETNCLEQWYLEFNQPETLDRIGLKDNLLHLEDCTPYMKNTSILPLTPKDYYSGAIVFKDIRSTSISLKSNDTPEKITLHWKNFPDLGIWQPADAPFICIEPWQGHGDPFGFKGDIFEKPGIITLKPEEVFSACLQIELHNTSNKQ